MQQQADRDGKDLPEQLKFGQPELAQQTLNKMIEKVRSGKMTSEEAAKFLDEVARSVSRPLLTATLRNFCTRPPSNCAAATNRAAAQSLASAAKELEKIQAQMADAKALQGSLDALNKAEMCLATHTCLRPMPALRRLQRKVPGGRTLFGPGQSQRRTGVGTWTDDDSQLYPQMSGLWDNSGINRPDRDPRGLTDRGDPQLADNLSPTKLHGQITPGSPMPSITLKGSQHQRAKFRRLPGSRTAAQSDAKSALEPGPSAEGVSGRGEGLLQRHQALIAISRG
jgi:polyhydroxyalkanoate synthesis regulator phasin